MRQSKPSRIGFEEESEQDDSGEPLLDLTTDSFEIVGGTARAEAQNQIAEERESDDDKSDPTVDKSDCRPFLPLFKRRYVYRSRTAGTRKPISKLRERRMKQSQRLDNPFQKKIRKCCSSLCFSNVEPVHAFREYKKYMSSERKGFKEALIAMYDRSEGRFKFQGRLACSRFLWRAFGFSPVLQSCVKGTERSRASPSAVAMPRDIRRETAKGIIVRFLRTLAEEVGDVMPHRAFTNIPDATRLQVFQRFGLQFLKNHGGSNLIVPTKSYFYRIWKLHCPDIRTRRHHGFIVCSMCELLRSELTETQTVEKRNKTIAIYRSHLTMMWKERQGYQKRSELAIQNPRKYCSMVIDGADQKKYGLPHFMNSTKSDKGHRLKVKCVGVLEHRKEKKLSLFPMTEGFATGANHVVEAAHRTLLSRKMEMGKLPEILFLQADNCTRENKNRFFLAYFEMLVAMGVFVSIQISFLPVGHTHADIDQAFSCISRRLKFFDTRTMNELLSELEQCYLPKARSEQMLNVANFSGLCENTTCLNAVKGFSKFRYFRFTREDQDDQEGKYYSTECHVKMQDADEWVSLESPAKFKSFLAFVPNLEITPDTITNPPDNALEITRCLRSVEERVKSATKMQELRDLRDIVYQKRMLKFHWELEYAFELNGDCAKVVPEGGNAEWKDRTEEVSASALDYPLNTFVAVKTEPSASERFWIALILGVASTDENERAVDLKIRWFTPRSGGLDAFVSAYEPAYVFDSKSGNNISYEAVIETGTILVHFDSLTKQGTLRQVIQTAIRHTLNLH